MKFLMLNVASILIFTNSAYTNQSNQTASQGQDNRRLLNGAPLTSYEKPFVVYITKGVDEDDGWICAGAIVKPKYILTAAACVIVDTPLFVIAGVKKYIRPLEWGSGQCIKDTKRKIVKICRPKDYKYNPRSFFEWGTADIAVAEVDKPYDFYDVSVRMHCDYMPKPIRINYEKRYQSSDVYAFIYGWGHRYGHLRPHDTINYKEGVMRYANTKIIPRLACSKLLPKMSLLNSTICTASGHGFDLDFLPLYTDEKKIPKKNMECTEGAIRRFDNDSDCFNETYSDEDFADEDYNNMTDLDGRRVIASGGLCQDDHGAPLTTFVGSEEILIGIGIAPLYDRLYRCREPNFFTSTYCMSMFLRCVLNEPPLLITRRLCHEYTKKEGFYIEEIDKNVNKVDDKKK